MTSPGSWVAQPAGPDRDLGDPDADHLPGHHRAPLPGARNGRVRERSPWAQPAHGCCRCSDPKRRRAAGGMWPNVLLQRCCTRRLRGTGRSLPGPAWGEQFLFHVPVSDDATLDTAGFGALVYGVVGAEFATDGDDAGFWDLRFADAKTCRWGRVFIAASRAQPSSVRRLRDEHRTRSCS